MDIQESDDSSRFTGHQVEGLDAYRTVALQAATFDHWFAMFKRDPHYTVVLEHVWPSLGGEYLAIVQERSPQLLRDMMDAVHVNNKYGDPFRSEYPVVGKVSPTQLRYLKVLSDLQLWLGPKVLDGGHLVEIGVGYGGQCQLILAAHPVASYVLVDLPEVELLAKRYVGVTAPPERAKVATIYQDMDPEKGLRKQSDLFISNYAFSELHRTVQEAYFERFVRRCRHGYVTYNEARDAGAMDVGDFVEKLKKIGRKPSIAPEEPKTSDTIFLVTW